MGSQNIRQVREVNEMVFGNDQSMIRIYRSSRYDGVGEVILINHDLQVFEVAKRTVPFRGHGFPPHLSHCMGPLLYKERLGSVIPELDFGTRGIPTQPRVLPANYSEVITERTCSANSARTFSTLGLTTIWQYIMAGLFK